MDPVIWEYSLKNTFPFNISLTMIVAACIGMIGCVIFSPFGKYGPATMLMDTYFMKVAMSTFAVSLIAYYFTDKLIESFK